MTTTLLYQGYRYILAKPNLPHIVLGTNPAFNKTMCNIPLAKAGPIVYHDDIIKDISKMDAIGYKDPGKYCPKCVQVFIEDGIKERHKTLLHAVGDWIGGRTLERHRLNLVGAIEETFPDGVPKSLKTAGTFYRLWVDESMDMFGWDKDRLEDLLTEGYPLNDKAKFTSYSKTYDAIAALVRKYEGITNAFIERKKVGIDDVFIDLEKLVLWMREKKIAGVKNLPTHWRREQEVLVALKGSHTDPKNIIKVISEREIWDPKTLRKTLKERTW